MSETNLRAVLAADMELGAGNVLRRLAEHGADMDMPRLLSFLAPGDADPLIDRDGEVRAALGAGATRLPLRIATIPDDDIVVGPTGKVRKFLMREQLLTGTGVS